VASDVLGRVVEVASGQPLDEFFSSRIFGPLGMTDTGFFAPPAELPRLAALYGLGPDRKAARLDALAGLGRASPALLGGGGGLVSSAADYHRFTQMLLNRAESPAGELDGVRLLSPRTVRYMGRNHLPGGADIDTFDRSLSPAGTFRGIGFGLGFAVVLDPVPGKVDRSGGELSWGGMASTAFWIDNSEELTASFFTQLVPSSAHPVRPQLRQLVYQALT
jgi:CubicO group peptidase (beta-lactamase class C family)